MCSNNCQGTNSQGNNYIGINHLGNNHLGNHNGLAQSDWQIWTDKSSNCAYFFFMAIARGQIHLFVKASVPKAFDKMLEISILKPQKYLKDKKL